MGKRLVVGFSFVVFLLAATSSAAPSKAPACPAQPARAKAPACAGPGQECKASADCCGSLNCLASRNPRETNKQRCY